MDSERKVININDIELYGNNDVMIDFSLPKPVEELTGLLDTLYDVGEDLKHNLYLNGLHVYCKSVPDGNVITKSRFNKIPARYGA